MPDILAAERRSSFRKHYLQWLVVHHLLSAGLVRELAMSTVRLASAGSLSLSDLFDETPPIGPAATSSWFLSARGAHSGLPSYLCQLVFAIVWQGDHAPSIPRNGLTADEAHWAKTLNYAVSLSAFDLAVIPYAAESIRPPESLENLVAALMRLSAACTDGTDLDIIENLNKATEGCAPILQTLIAKHFGDLCGDQDNWRIALAHYETARTFLKQADATVWREAASALLSMLAQSIAMATWHLEGAEKASQMLEPLAARGNLKSTPLSILNANFDILNAHSTTGATSSQWFERRVASLETPQLISSYKIGSALTLSDAKRFQDAHRLFWAILRRQIGLGGTAASKLTKSQYGRSIIAGLEATIDRQRRREAFMLGVRLLIEGGRAEVVEEIFWTERAIETYIDKTTLPRLEHIVKRAPGMQAERTMVVATLLREWLKVLPSDAIDLAQNILLSLARLAQADSFAGCCNIEIIDFAIKALKEIGSQRPEFRRILGVDLTQILDSVIERWGPLPIANAIEMVSVFVESSPPEIAERLGLKVIGLVEKLPNNAFWPIVRAASDLLRVDTFTRIAANNEHFKRLRTRALVRLALNSQSEHTSLMYLLRTIDPAAIEDQIDAHGLNSIVNDIKNHAVDISSNTMAAYIHALLVAPKISGRQGVMTALVGLRALIDSTTSQRPSPALANGYEPLLLLAREGDKIVTESGLDANEFRNTLLDLVNSIVNLWRTAANRPLIFAGFSIPPKTSPNKNIVHNWTFATLEFARYLNIPTGLVQALDEAAQNDLLADPIAVARAIQTEASDALDPKIVNYEKADAFYAALGQRLIGINNQTDTEAIVNAQLLLNRCFQVGPRGEDAALLLIANQLSIRFLPESADVANYVAKVRRHPQLRLSLTPLVQRVLECG